jgi:hypothetical protein
MNLDNLTFKEVKALASTFGLMTQQEWRSILVDIKEDRLVEVHHATRQKNLHPFVGKYVIARCYAAGVHAGEVVSVDGDNVILKDSRRLWSWKAKDGVALSGVAQNGLESEGKVDTLNPEIALMGVCELIPCSAKTRESIDGFK